MTKDKNNTPRPYWDTNSNIECLLLPGATRHKYAYFDIAFVCRDTGRGIYRPSPAQSFYGPEPKLRLEVEGCLGPWRDGGNEAALLGSWVETHGPDCWEVVEPFLRGFPEWVRSKCFRAILECRVSRPVYVLGDSEQHKSHLQSGAMFGRAYFVGFENEEDISSKIPNEVSCCPFGSWQLFEAPELKQLTFYKHWRVNPRLINGLITSRQAEYTYKRSLEPELFEACRERFWCLEDKRVAQQVEMERKLDQDRQKRMQVDLVASAIGVRKRSQLRYLYLMKCNRNGLYKIGVSKNPKHRETTLASEDPSIGLVAQFPKRSDFEKALHMRYDAQRKRGEWFALTAIQVKWICTTMMRPRRELEDLFWRNEIAA